MLKNKNSLGQSWRVGLQRCGDLEVHSRVLNLPSIRSLEVVKNLKVLFVFVFVLKWRRLGSYPELLEVRAGGGWQDIGIEWRI